MSGEHVRIASHLAKVGSNVPKPGEVRYHPVTRPGRNGREQCPAEDRMASFQTLASLLKGPGEPGGESRGMPGLGGRAASALVAHSQVHADRIPVQGAG